MKNHLVICLVSAVTACAPVHQNEPKSNMTVGVVQKEIRIGMAAADVATALGSPNIISLDENKDEVWVYDKVSTQVQQSASQSGVWLLLVGGQSESARASKNSRTLTVIIRLDQD